MNVLHDVCRNCGGGFVQRQIRPLVDRRHGISRIHNAESTKRRSLNYALDCMAARVAATKDIPPLERQAGP